MYSTDTTDLTYTTGDCVKANTQLVTLVALNITTDAMLILLPMPWLLRVRKSWWKYVPHIYPYLSI